MKKSILVKLLIVLVMAALVIAPSYVFGAGTLSMAITPPADTVVAPGDMLGPFTIWVTNNTESPFTYEIQKYVDRPNGTTSYMRPLIKTIGGARTAKIKAKVRIPQRARDGSYAYGVRVSDIHTDILDIIIDEDSFDFFVTTCGFSEDFNDNVADNWVGRGQGIWINLWRGCG